MKSLYGTLPNFTIKEKEDKPSDGLEISILFLHYPIKLLRWWNLAFLINENGGTGANILHRNDVKDEG